MKSLSYLMIAASVLGLFVLGCEKRADNILEPEPVNLLSAPVIAGSHFPEVVPSPLVTVNFGGNSLTFWPFTGADLLGTPMDPINLIFVGNVDPRALRAALLSLDGNRTAYGFPDAFPFNSTWSDDIGGSVQTAYFDPDGWTGSAIQLQCGDYQAVRFHLRLFSLGNWTLAGVHFEVLIPGTTEHQVLSWELAEQLVLKDFIRSGLLDSTTSFITTNQINPSPYREIPAIIYNGLPVGLRAAIDGPLGDVTDPVPMATDGKATILNVAGSVTGTPGVFEQEFVINFNQVIPKPFCASGPFDFLFVQGPVKFSQKVTVSPSGNYVSQFRANGHLDITPVNPLTEPPTPVGETYQAVVNERHTGIVTDQVTLASSFQMQIELPPTGPFRGQLIIKLNVGPGGSNNYSINVKCLP